MLFEGTGGGGATGEWKGPVQRKAGTGGNMGSERQAAVDESRR